MTLVDDMLKGIWKLNPTFRLILGMCPALAVTSMAINGVAMGLATLFVLIGSALIISLIKNFVPEKTRIPIFIVTIATFVTIADFVMNAFFPPIHKVLGIYVPLIVVNCIILARAEAFSSRQPVSRSLADAFGMGLGFTLGLTILASIREILGFGTIFGFTALGFLTEYPLIVMRLPTGAFITLGLLIALMNFISKKVSQNA